MSPFTSMPSIKPLPDKVRVMVVDDESPIRECASMTLMHLGAEVLQASDGLEAVTIFSSQPDQIGLVIMDISMPIMNGIEATERIRAINSEVKIILSSGGSNLDCSHLHPNAFLPKPYTATSLCETVRRVLQEP